MAELAAAASAPPSENDKATDHDREMRDSLKRIEENTSKIASDTTQRRSLDVASWTLYVGIAALVVTIMAVPEFRSFALGLVATISKRRSYGSGCYRLPSAQAKVNPKRASNCEV